MLLRSDTGEICIQRIGVACGASAVGVGRGSILKFCNGINDLLSIFELSLGFLSRRCLSMELLMVQRGGSEGQFGER